MKPTTNYQPVRNASSIADAGGLLTTKKGLAPLDFLIGTRPNRPSEKSRNCTGFTLIEILVVTTIIAILAAIGIVSYSQTNKNARDKKRQADIEQIRSALEMYRADEGVYPTDLGDADFLDYIADFPTPPSNSTCDMGTPVTSYDNDCVYSSAGGTSYTIQIDREMTTEYYKTNP